MDNEGRDFFIGIIMGIGLMIFIAVIPDIGMIKIQNTDWKCTQAIIIDDDPSKTECVVYKRKDK